MSFKRVFITGGAGFIGSHMAKRMLDKGHTVWIIDNLSTGSIGNIPTGAEFIPADLTNSESLNALPTNFDVVIHFAAQSSGEISFDDPSRDLQSNALATIHLLQFCKKHGIRRFMFSSSFSVYGDHKYLPMDEAHPVDPQSFYAVSKLTAEHQIRLFQRQGIETTIFRLFNVYGPGQNLRNLRQGMASIYLAYIMENRPIIVKGSLERFRDFIFVEDVVETFQSSIENERTFGETINLGSGEKTSVKELIELQLRVCGHDPATYPISVLGGTPGDTFGSQADIQKCERLIGTLQRHSLQQGMIKTVDWVRAIVA